MRDGLLIWTDDENENEPLLSDPCGAAVEEKTGLQFYLYMFRHRKFVAGCDCA